jgi:hypothetical protein
MTLTQANAVIAALNSRALCACAAFRVALRHGVQPAVTCQRHTPAEEPADCHCGNGVCG